MASSRKRLRTTSEILQFFDDCSSEGDLDIIDDSDENEDVCNNKVSTDMDNAASSDSDSDHVENDLDERLYDPPTNLQDHGENNESSDDSNDEENEWQEYDEDIHKLKRFPFTGKQQFFPPSDGRPMCTPLDFFNLFFSIELFQLIADETNAYAHRKINMKRPLQKYSIWHEWKDMTVKEMRAFHGILIHIALLRNVTINEVFSSRKVDSREFAKNVFSKRRFLQIFWALHVSPPSESKEIFEGRRSKVRQVIDYVTARFLQYYHPGPNLSADESTVPSKGRIAFKVYNPMKPTKWGLRVYDIACALSGYVLALIPYFGKATTITLGNATHKFNTRIILELVEIVINATKSSGYHVFTDRLYTNLELAKELLMRKIHLTGTIQTNRVGLPNDIKKGKIKLSPGKHVSFCKSNRYHVLSWRDKRYVTMLTTFYSSATRTVQRIAKGNVLEELTKPEVICEYNAYMGGVDKADHYCSSYAFIQKCLKWWRKLYFFVLEVAIVNSFLLYKMHRNATNEKKLSHRNYRKELCEQLVGDFRVKLRGKRYLDNKHEVPERLRNDKLHIMNSIPDNRFRDCVVCSDLMGTGVVRKLLTVV